MVVRSNLKIGDNLQSADSKRALNERMFTEIAPRYDFITRVLSFGRDASWKKDMVAQLPDIARPHCLDLACGTGDLSFLVAQKYRDGEITGMDITPSMLVLARGNNTYPNVQFVAGDMGDTQLPAASVDIITGGYALRNAPDLEKTIQEIHRLLKPGGVAAFLDFSKPDGRTAQSFEYHLLKVWTGLWGVLLHRNPQVYNYIAESLAQYPSRGALRRLFEAQGFRFLSARLNFFGITETFLVQKR